MITPEILYEDNHLLVLSKPPCYLSQADSSKRPDILNWGKNYLKEKYQKPGQVYLGLLHRLDFKVGGVIALAKTSKAAARISEQFQKRLVKKDYLAVVEGCPNKTEDTIENKLSRKNYKTVLDQNGKSSILKWKQLKVLKNYDLSLLDIDLISGFKHQIRAQLSLIGHPIIFDYKYGSQEKANLETEFGLWAYGLHFQHPITKEMMNFYKKPPLNLLPWSISAIKEYFKDIKE